jgi:hypothetical protein
MAKIFKVLLQDLKDGDETSRIGAVQALTNLDESHEEIVRALERAVVSDSSQKVQAAALAALAEPIHHQIHCQLGQFTLDETRQLFLHHIDEWATDNLITPQLTAVLKGRYAIPTETHSLPETANAMPQKAAALHKLLIKKQEARIPAKSASPVAVNSVEEALNELSDEKIAVAPILTAQTTKMLFDGELEAESEDRVFEPPLLEKQKFSLVGAFTSEVTIKVALYLGAFLILAAAVIFAGLVEPARFPMLTLTILGFLTGAGTTIQRLPLGSFVLFVIGTLLIPIDAAVLLALINVHSSLLYWAVVMVGMSITWVGGTYFYQSRFFSLMIFACFSIAVYLVAASYVSIESAQFFLVVSLVALAGLGEAALLRRWQGNDFFVPMFAVAQLQAVIVLGILVNTLLSQVSDLLSRIEGNGHLRSFDAEEIALLGAWLTLGVFYFTSDYLTRRMKKAGLPNFRILVICCLMTPPIFIMEAIAADPHQIAAVLWGWGALMVIAAEALYFAPIQWRRTYSYLFLFTSILFLMAAPLVEYVVTLEYAVGYFVATSLVFFLLAYRRLDWMLWSFAFIAAYLAYLVGVKVLGTGASPLFTGFALLIPSLVLWSVELAGRRSFRADYLWTVVPLLLGVFNALWDVGILISWYESHPDTAAIIFLIYGIYAGIYAVLDDQRENHQAMIAWTAGLTALYGAYINVVPNVNQLEFGGYMLLAPALVFLASELIGKRYFQATPLWTQPLLGLGLLNVILDILATLDGGLNAYPGSAALIFLIYGLFSLLYAWFSVEAEHNFALMAWTTGLIALYVAYVFVYLMPAIERLEIFPGFAFLLPALVFFSAELVGKRYFQASQSWTQPLFWLGLFSAALVVPVTLEGGLDAYPGNAALIFLIYGLFSLLYAWFSVEYDIAIIAWVVGLIALYVAYGFGYLMPAIERLEIFPGFVLLLPALVFFSAELVGKRYFQASQSWTQPLFWLGLLNAVLVVPVTLDGGLDAYPGSAALIFLIYGLFGLLYVWFSVEYDIAIIAWTVGLVALYVAYGFGYLIPAIERLDIFPGFVLLLPALVFLSAELVGKYYFRVSQPWTLPLFWLGFFNAALIVPITLEGGLDAHPGSAALIFLIYGLFGLLYTWFRVRDEDESAIIAWVVGLIALYVAYGFGYLIPAIERLDIFPGFVLLLPGLVFFSAELVGKRYFQASQSWTQPLFWLGFFNAGLVVPVTLEGGLDAHPGSAALIFLIYGLFAALYAVLDARVELGYLATFSIVLALIFALLYYDQDRWVIPFIVLTLLYYMGGLAIHHFYHRDDWSQVLHWSGLGLGTVVAFSSPIQGEGDAVVGMGVIATLYGVEAFRTSNIWFGLPANGLFLGAYFIALQTLEVTEPQFYSTGTALLAVITHYLLYQRREERGAFLVGFTTGWIAQVILLGTSFIQMSAGLEFFFLLFFQSLALLGYGLMIRSLSFTIMPILFVVGGVLRVVFTVLADYSTVVILGCTGLSLLLVGIAALGLRDRLLKAYE